MKKFLLTISCLFIYVGTILILISQPPEIVIEEKIIEKEVIKTEYVEVPVEKIIIEREYVEIPVYEEPAYYTMDVLVTAYCNEHYHHICNNGDFSSTSTGTVPTVGRTIAVDPNMIPYGSMVEIDGHIYIAEDTGGSIIDNRIDILVTTHQEALNWGVQNKTIKVYT